MIKKDQTPPESSREFSFLVYWFLKLCPKFHRKVRSQLEAKLLTDFHDYFSSFRVVARQLDHQFLKAKLTKKQKELKHSSPNDPRRREHI